MRWSIASGALLLAGVAQAATWTFSDASVTVASKTAEDVTQTCVPPSMAICGYLEGQLSIPIAD